MTSLMRPKTRRKRKGPDILGSLYTSSAISCHGHANMCSPYTRGSRAVLLIAVIILGIVCDSVHGCNVDHCWEEFQTALNQGRQGVDQVVQCTSLRTYLKCLSELQGCKGNIQFHSVRKVIRNQMSSNKCQTEGPVYTGVGISPDVLLPPDELCTYKGKKVYKHCGLFGDPHLRTFDQRFQTCRVEGAWPLINNDFLTVQVTNDPVSNSLGATATSKLTVLIKRNTICTATDKYITYQAESGVLPSTFDDGQTTYGKSHSVKLIEVEPGKHIEIKIKYIDTKILVRQVGSYLTFAITMPEELTNSSGKNGLELCVRGCPKSEIIDYQSFLNLKKKEIKHTVMSRKEAEKLCLESNLMDFYLDSCVFDLMTTGNENFTVSAYSALQDVLKLDPDYRKTQENRTTLTIYDVPDGASSYRTNYVDLVRILIATVITWCLTHQLTRT